MNYIRPKRTFSPLSILLLCSLISNASAQLSETDLELRAMEFQTVVELGKKNFYDPGLGTRGSSCGDCHMDGSQTRTETYPKYKGQFEKVVTFAQMINWCIVGSLRGEALALDSDKMVSLITYLKHQRRDVELAPGTYNDF